MERDSFFQNVEADAVDKHTSYLSLLYPGLCMIMTGFLITVMQDWPWDPYLVFPTGDLLFIGLLLTILGISLVTFWAIRLIVREDDRDSKEDEIIQTCVWKFQKIRSSINSNDEEEKITPTVSWRRN